MSKLKLVIVVNGCSGVGKDTLINSLSSKYAVWNRSSIDQIREIARVSGWDGKKDIKGRNLLYSLKKCFIDYNDSPTKYLIDCYDAFCRNKNIDILAVHIREPEEISKFITKIIHPHVTILIKSSRVENDPYSIVNDYNYDFVFRNDDELNASCKKFLELIDYVMLDISNPRCPN